METQAGYQRRWVKFIFKPTAHAACNTETCDTPEVDGAEWTPCKWRHAETARVAEVRAAAKRHTVETGHVVNVIVTHHEQYAR